MDTRIDLENYILKEKKLLENEITFLRNELETFKSDRSETRSRLYESTQVKTKQLQKLEFINTFLVSKIKEYEPNFDISFLL